MRCYCCKKDLPESEFSRYRISKKSYICKKCFNARAKEYRNKKILSDSDKELFEHYYGGIKINITNYPQAYEIFKTSGEYFITKDKEQFIKKLLDILK